MIKGMNSHGQGTFCMPGTVLNVCVYTYSHVILGTSQLGKDDNCPHGAEEEKEAQRGS